MVTPTAARYLSKVLYFAFTSLKLASRYWLFTVSTGSSSALSISAPVCASVFSFFACRYSLLFR